MIKEELLEAKQNLLKLKTLKLSGYPTIDKPWTVNYNQKELGKKYLKGQFFRKFIITIFLFPKI